MAISEGDEPGLPWHLLDQRAKPIHLGTKLLGSFRVFCLRHKLIEHLISALRALFRPVRIYGENEGDNCGDDRKTLIQE